MPDIDELLKDPASRYGAPREVLTDRSLDRRDKERVLQAWLKDAQLLSQAEGENMAGGERPRLQEVKLALAELDRLPPHDP